MKAKNFFNTIINFLLNLLWFVLGGFIIVIEYFLSSLFLLITIIGIPFGIQTLKLSYFACAPFGKTIVDNGWAKGILPSIMNVIWIIFGGLELALCHLILGIVLCFTIIGIPFGLQHFKLMYVALVPFGSKIISKTSHLKNQNKNSIDKADETFNSHK